MPDPKRFRLGIDKKDYRRGIVDTSTGRVVDLTCYYDSRPSSETLTVNVRDLENLLNKIHEQGKEMWNQEERSNY